MVALEQSHRVVKLIEVITGWNLAQMEVKDVPFRRPLCFSRDGGLLVTMGGPELLQVRGPRAIRRGRCSLNKMIMAVGPLMVE